MGEKNFRKLIERHHCSVDKTRFNKQQIDEPTDVPLVTRPRFLASYTDSFPAAYDSLLPKKKNALGIIPELKSSEAQENLKLVAQEALQQIDHKAYAVEFKKEGV